MHQRLMWLSLILLFVGSLGAMEKKAEARTMVHLLDYISVDYAGAVHREEIINPGEYAEMQEFAQSLIAMAHNTPAHIQGDLALLSRLIEAKSAETKINSLAQSIKNALITEYQLAIAPTKWPLIERGKELFAVHCASCHGAQGKGDGPLAKALDPAPTNFHSAEKRENLAAFHAFNTIRLGLEGTAMRAFDELNDDEVWDLAFYLMSLPHEAYASSLAAADLKPEPEVGLDKLASLNNLELEALLSNPSPELIAALRLDPKTYAHPSDEGYLAQARKQLQDALEAYAQKDFAAARNFALSAYLEGVEPVEAQIRARDARFAVQLEKQMAQTRSLIEARESYALIKASVEESTIMLKEAEALSDQGGFSAWMAFLLSASIIFREGLEAFLVVLTVLGILRAMKLKGASIWIHGGWIAAILSGVALWFMAGKLIQFNGAQRELMEGVIALFAVGVLLYVGFWMHSKSEAGKWKAYIHNRIGRLAKTENMLGLAFFSFLVVFREAFESVLFLSALRLEVGPEQQIAFGGGIAFAFLLLGIIAVLMLRFSAKIPIPKLFRYGSIIIGLLALILTGKGVYALQESGMLNINLFPLDFRLDTLGLYGTWETVIAQLLILSFIIVLYKLPQWRRLLPSVQSE